MPRTDREPERAAELPGDVLERLRGGDPVAFDRVYEAYRARLYSFLLRMSRDPALARDLSQETWLRLAANARSLLAGSDLGAWLFTVARNLFLSQRRFLRVERLRRALAGDLAQLAPQPSPFETLATSGLERRLERALSELPVAQRELVLLISVEGFESTEVAAMLGLAPATVRQRLKRARDALRRALADDGSVTRGTT